MLAAKAVLFLAFSCAFAEPRLERRFGPELKPRGAPIACESAVHGGSAVAGMVNRLRGGGIFGGKVGGRFGGTVVGSTVMAPKAGTADLGTVAETKEINVIKTAPNLEEKRDEGAASGDGSKTAAPSSKVPTADSLGMDGGAGGQEAQLPRPKKYIYIISDSTGFTASHALTSCVAQYDGLSVDEEGAPEARVELQTQMFSNVYTWNKIEKIIQLASRMKAMVIYSLVSKDLCRKLQDLCKRTKVICHDVIGPVLNKLTHYMEAEPSLRPRSSAENVRKPLSGQYFKRIEAVEFTIKQDDGALCRNLGKADLILLGVSRSSKTPLSMYLAQQYGYKVANVPLVLGIPPPPEIYDVDPRTVIGLTIQPMYLKRIRTTRLKGTGVDTNTIGVNQGSHDYTNIKYINQELKQARDLYNENPQWTVLDVTGRAVEENAAIIAELMPGKPTPVEAALHALDCTFFIIDPNPTAHRTTYDETHRPACDALEVETESEWTLENPIVFASDGFCQAVGYTREEIIGKPPWVLHGPDTDKDTIAAISKCLSEGKEGHFEILNYRKDGTTFLKELHLSPVQDLQGKTAFVFATQCTLNPLAFGFHPVKAPTQEEEGEFKRERMEEDKKEQILKNVQNKGFISVCIYDGTIPDLPLVFASEGFFKMTLYEPQEILGHNLLMLRGKKTDPKTVEKIKEAIRKREDISTCILNYRKDGSKFWNYISLQPVLDKHKELRYYVGTQYAGTHGIGNKVRDLQEHFPSGLQTHASVAPVVSW